MTNEIDSLYPVCPETQLNHAECLEFMLHESIVSQLPDKYLANKDAFVINWQGQHYAYLNSCPHTHVNLNWTPNQFLDVESHFIQCGLHGAIFEPQTGLCLRGPCLGQSLACLPTVLHEGTVCIDMNALKAI